MLDIKNRNITLITLKSVRIHNDEIMVSATSALTRSNPPLLSKSDPTPKIELTPSLFNDVVMMSHHGRRTKETLLYLPPLVPSGPTNRIPSTGLRKTGMPGRPPQEEAKGMARAESGLLHRAADSRSQPARSTAGTTASAHSLKPTSLGHRANPVRDRRR